MNDRFDSTRYALDDDELDGLLSGRAPGPGVEPDNPVVEFFSEARRARFADRPTPTPELQAMFAARGAPAAPDPAAEDVTVAANRTAPVVEPPPPEGSPAVEIGSSPLLPPSGPNTEELQAVFVSARGPSWDESVGGASAAPPAAVRALAPARPSTLQAIGAVLRPTPSKILVGVSLLLAAFITGAVFGFIDISGDSSQNVAGVETTLEPPSTTTTTSAASDDQAAPAIRPTTTVPVSTSRPTDPPPLTTPTTEPPTTTTTVETSVSSAPTETTEAPTTTIEAPTTETSEPVTTETTETTDPTTTVPTSETTLPDTSTTLTTIEVITPGRNLAVPGDLQAGSYSAPVEGSRVCTIAITYAEGNTDTFSANPGTTVVFSLFEGSVVRTTQGCPQIYTVITG